MFAPLQEGWYTNGLCKFWNIQICLASMITLYSPTVTLCQRICICIKGTCRSAEIACAMEQQDLCIKRFDEQQPPHQLSPPCKVLLMLPQLLRQLAASNLIPFKVCIHFLPTSSYPHTADPREVAFQSFGICPRAVGVVIIIILSQLLQ